MVQESYDDITGNSLFDNLNIRGTKRWRSSPPEVCPYCDSQKTIHGIEIIAAYDGNVINVMKNFYDLLNKQL